MQDVSLENLGVDLGRNVKHFDFGAVIAVPDCVGGRVRTTPVGKFEYMAPEVRCAWCCGAALRSAHSDEDAAAVLQVYNGSAFDPVRADLWSAGACLYYMLFGGEHDSSCLACTTLFHTRCVHQCRFMSCRTP